MAFSSFANSSGNAMMGGAAGAGGLTHGPDLPLIQTESLGFLSIAGDSRVQLSPKWSPEPVPTASLLAIASRKGLVAAAGPEAIHLATTESVRKAFEAEKNGDTEVRPFQPQATVPLSIRICQLAFTTDEKYLIASAETGGGLAVYDVQTLLQGTTQPAFEISTSGETVRALTPNPNPESANLCAVVTSTGNLLMVNLNERVLVAGQNGPILRAQVSCAAWSTKGKQLVAGMADGIIQQMTPDGADKGQIPKPPGLGDYHVTSLSWLENHVFLAIYNATNGGGLSTYQLITRHQAPGGAPPTFTFQKLTDPVEPFNEKVPHHTVLRLKDFPPNLQDLLLVSSTSIENIGILTRSKSPLSTDRPAEEISGVFTTTELADDSKRAQLPMGEDLSDTYPIGVTLDLSSKDKVFKPIPSDEIDYSPTPLPGLWALNNEGVLSCWWIIYNDSIRGGTGYPGLVAADASAASQPAQATFASAAPAPALSPSAFGTPATSQPALGGSAAAAPAFGGPSLLGAKQSPWSTGTAPAFGSSSFGGGPAPSAPALGNASGSSVFGSKPAAPAFGQASTMGLGAKAPSPWASAGTSAAAPAFGQSGFASAGATSGKVFGGGNSTASPASGGFASFANNTNASGFGSLGGGTGAGAPSIFGSKPSGGSFVSSTPEVSMDNDTAFPPPSANKNASKPAFGSSPFQLGTTFKPDPKTANDNEDPKEGGGSSMFGGGFSLSLNKASKEEAASASKDEDMDSTTPLAVPDKTKSIFGTSTAPTKSIFGLGTSSAADKPKSIFDTTPSASDKPTEKPKSIFDTTPSASDKPKSAFGFSSTTPTTTPGVGKSSIFGSTTGSASPAVNPFGVVKPASGGTSGIFGQSSMFGDASKKSTTSIFGSAKVKEEDEDKENLANIPEAPLPPDSTKSEEIVKPSSAQVEDAPLPSDFSSKLKRQSEPEPSPWSPDFTKKTVESAPLPPDFTKSKSSVPAFVPSVPDSEEGEDFEDDEDEDEGEEDEGEEEEEEEDEEDEPEESEAGSEGSGVDVAKDLSPSTSGLGGQTPGITPHSSFGGMGGSTFSLTSRPDTQPRPLFGEISRNVPALPRPVPQSPRSPSPVRGSISRLRSEGTRSVSAPGAASHLLGRSQQSSMFGQSAPPKQPRITLDPNVEEQRKLAAKREAETQKILEDPEDAGMQELLNAPIESSVHLGEFLAGQSTPSASNGKGSQAIPEAAETVWKDINRMVDYVGLNSRTLRKFIQGHTELYKQTGREKGDLENPDDWVLVEAEDLGMMIDSELSRDLADGRIKDLERTKKTIEALSRDLAKLRAKEDDLRKIVASQVDPDQVAVAKSMPLSAEQAAQQNELRKAFQQFSKHLVEAEDSLTLLKAKMASAGGASGKTPVPTVDAIIRTINKMTSMAEKRSGDVDVLETQMRRLGLGSGGLNGEAQAMRVSPGPGGRSREGSPFVGTPQKPGSARRSLIMSPERSIMRESLASSVGSRTPVGAPTPPRKKMSNYSEAEKQAVRRKKARREAMFGLLRGSLEKTGPNVQRLEDDD